MAGKKIALFSICLFCGMIAFFVGRMVCAAENQSAASLGQEIDQNGAKVVVDRLVKQNQWDEVSREISNGNQEWIDLAFRLAPGTDAGPSEELGIDLALALPKNPQGILAAIKKNGVINIKYVCSMPFIEDSVPKNYHAKTIKAVQSVSNPALSNEKQACLTALTQAN